MKLQHLALLISLVLLGSCGGESSSAKSKAADRGSASMLIGTESWTADRAKAKVKGSKLTLDLSRTESVGGTMKRDQLTMSFQDFDGPGAYTGSTGCVLVRMGLSTSATTEEQVKESLKGSETYMLMDVKLVIDSADDEWIEGSFHYDPPEGYQDKQVSLSQGQFRAKMR